VAGTAVAFSPDGQALAVGGEGTLCLCRAATGEVVRRFEGRPGRVYALAFSPDGKTLVSGVEGGKVYLWEVATGQERCRCEGHETTPHAVAFSPDGRVLASCGGSLRGGRDLTVRLWDAVTGKELRRLTGHRGTVWAASFSPDGKVVASASADSTLLLWEVPAPAAPSGAGAVPARLDGLWADLAGADAARAYRATGALAASPGEAVPFLRERLRPAALPEARRLAKLIADLDSDQFAVRDKAAGELEKLGELAAPALKEALKGRRSSEARRRLELLLAVRPPAGDRLRELRALEVLERAGTAGAREVLRDLAGGAPEARLTQEAKASLERLRLRAGR
jgi:hypothetical protein